MIAVSEEIQQGYTPVAQSYSRTEPCSAFEGVEAATAEVLVLRECPAHACS